MNPTQSSQNRSASFMLVMMLALAACIALGGVMVAQREVETRLARDRAPQRALANAMQTEARKLEQLYDEHLKRTGGLLTNVSRDSQAPRRLAENVEGIQRISWLYWKSASAETHLSLGFPPDPPLPEPTLETKHSGLPRSRVLLDPKIIFRDAGGKNEGWIDEPGKPFMFFVQQFGTTVILTIDRSAVEAAITRHFRDMLQSAFSSVAQLGGPDAVRDSSGHELKSTENLPNTQPDVLSPVVSRFGSWQIVSWDQREMRETYHLPTLVGSLALAVLVAVCGFGLSAQQRRAALLARQRVSFVNRVSHELRTPMTNILLNLDVIEESVPETATGRFGLVREEAGRLSRLIENVLTFSRQEEGRLTMQNTSSKPVEIVDGIVRQFEPALQRRGITLTRMHEGLKTEVMLDADALAQITANLLSNVEKYAPNGPVRVRTQQTETGFVLSVTDEGSGIAADDAGRIFEPFTRLDDRVQAGVSGAGLGLSIARELAQRMGGTLCLVNSEKGAAFELRLPLNQPTAR
ncbi:MAG: HAMP domain-containing sensor histidine kinase [Verrucomicrobia bacterium]|nr:HAMP domain-containing sensor histidine kinase [Verrucomicrobiota bacterium]